MLNEEAQKRAIGLEYLLGSGRTGWVNEPLLELTLPALEERQSRRGYVGLAAASPITVFQFPHDQPLWFALVPEIPPGIHYFKGRLDCC